MLLHSSEVARMLRLAPSTIRRAVENGQLAATYTPGGHYRYRLEDVIEFARLCGISIELPDAP